MEHATRLWMGRHKREKGERRSSSLESWPRWKLAILLALLWPSLRGAHQYILLRSAVLSVDYISACMERAW